LIMIDPDEMTDDEWEEWYETVARPRIVRRLRRLVNEFGYQVVMRVFSADMPEYRRDREQRAREREQEKRKRRASACALAAD